MSNNDLMEAFIETQREYIDLQEIILCNKPPNVYSSRQTYNSWVELLVRFEDCRSRLERINTILLASVGIYKVRS